MSGDVANLDRIARLLYLEVQEDCTPVGVDHLKFIRRRGVVATDC